jgi:hypothetical protein
MKEVCPANLQVTLSKEKKKKFAGMLLYRNVVTSVLRTLALFVCIISHQPAVLFSQNKPAPA